MSFSFVHLLPVQSVSSDIRNSKIFLIPNIQSFQTSLPILHFHISIRIKFPNTPRPIMPTKNGKPQMKNSATLLMSATWSLFQLSSRKMKSTIPISTFLKPQTHQSILPLPRILWAQEKQKQLKEKKAFTIN